MQLEVKIDESVKEPKIIVLTDKITPEISDLVQRLTEAQRNIIAGFRENNVTLLDEKELLRIFAANGKVYAVTPSGEYLLRLRLYELEDRLRPLSFVRISNSEIINLRRVKNFDMSFAGTICVTLCDGSKTYVSRRYVPKIKEVLGL
ncbi:MAG: LytTR family transcriptional regulator [Oscillospiraceae bacterium]|nr:LytTR family transcriptional regulator [Oscillospiraceae bacterium]